MYKIFGADGKEYGPVDGNEMRRWIAEGRVSANTQVLPQGAPAWVPISTLPEFSGLFVAAPTVLPAASAPAKTSGLAITALVLGILGCTSPIGLILGIVALAKINRSGGQLGGRGLAIAGIAVSAAMMIFSVIPFAMLLPALASAKDKAQTISCINNVKQLALAIRIHAGDNNDTLPKADKWCDEIMNEAGSPRIFVCPGANDGQRSHYAFNAKLSGKKDSEVNPQTVMIFECAGGWNKSGGPNDLVKHHKRNYVVGFVDGSVQQVSEARLSTLRWDP